MRSKRGEKTACSRRRVYDGTNLMMHTDTGLIHNENAVEKDHVRRGSSSRNCCESIGVDEMFNTDFQGIFCSVSRRFIKLGVCGGGEEPCVTHMDSFRDRRVDGNYARERERRIEPQIRQSIASLYGNENHATDRTHLHPLRLPISPNRLGRLQEVLNLGYTCLWKPRCESVQRSTA